MKNNSAKHQALKLLLQHRLYSLTDYNDLKHIIESNHFIIIEYQKHTNSEHVSELIKKLKIEKEIEQYESFLYLNKNLKFVFINSGLSDQDKCVLLRHELGHINDPALGLHDANYSKIKKEEFASEFSHYIKNPGICFQLYILMAKRWKVAVGLIILIMFVLGFYFVMHSPVIQPTEPATSDIASSHIVTNENSDSTYYVTSRGEKYHRKFCFMIKYKTNLTECTINEAKNLGYRPCLICIGEE